MADTADADSAREQGYALGYRAALNKNLRDILRELGYDSDEAARTRWVLEREQAVAQLRMLCAEVGDNDWPETLHLADVIEKHLARQVVAKLRDAFEDGEKSGMEMMRPLPR